MEKKNEQPQTKVDAKENSSVSTVVPAEEKQTAEQAERRKNDYTTQANDERAGEAGTIGIP